MENVSKEQAIAALGLLDSAVSQVALNRQDHARLVAASNSLKQFIQNSPDTNEVIPKKTEANV